MPFYRNLMAQAKQAENTCQDETCPCCRRRMEMAALADQDEEEHQAMVNQRMRHQAEKKNHRSNLAIERHKEKADRSHLGLLDMAAQTNQEMGRLLRKLRPEDVQALEKASKKGDVATIKSMMENGRLGVLSAASRMASSQTPVFLQLALAEAATGGHTELVTYLVRDVNCNPEKEAPGMLHRPLGLAALGGYLDTVQALTEHGANPTARDSGGRSALSLACEAGHLKVVQYLYPLAGDEFNIGDEQDMKDLREEIQEIQMAGAAISDHIVDNFRNSILEDPICAASAGDHADIVDYIFKQCAPNQRTLRWSLAFVAAPVTSGLSTLKLLLSKWANKEVMPSPMDEDAVVLGTLVSASRRCDGKMHVLQYLVPAFKELLVHRTQKGDFDELMVAAFAAYLMDHQKANGPARGGPLNNQQTIIEKVIRFYVVESKVKCVDDILHGDKYQISSKKIRDAVNAAVAERKVLAITPEQRKQMAEKAAAELLAEFSEEEAHPTNKGKKKKKKKTKAQKAEEKRKEEELAKKFEEIQNSSSEPSSRRSSVEKSDGASSSTAEMPNSKKSNMLKGKAKSEAYKQEKKLERAKIAAQKKAEKDAREQQILEMLDRQAQERERQILKFLEQENQKKKAKEATLQINSRVSEPASSKATSRNSSVQLTPVDESSEVGNVGLNGGGVQGGRKFQTQDTAKSMKSMASLQSQRSLPTPMSGVSENYDIYTRTSVPASRRESGNSKMDQSSFATTRRGGLNNIDSTTTGFGSNALGSISNQLDSNAFSANAYSDHSHFPPGFEPKEAFGSKHQTAGGCSSLFQFTDPASAFHLEMKIEEDIRNSPKPSPRLPPPTCPPPPPPILPQNHILVVRGWRKEHFTGPSQLEVESNTMVEFFPERAHAGWTYCKVLGTGAQGWLPHWCFDNPPGSANIILAD